MTKKLLRYAIFCSVVGLCACSPTAQNDQVSELKEKLWEALRTKDVERFIDCYFIEERFKTDQVREANRKNVENLLRGETIDIEIVEIPGNEMAEIRKLQKARDDTPFRYSLPPKKLLRIRQKPENGIAGRNFLIGEQKGKWYIVTVAGHTT